VAALRILGNRAEAEDACQEAAARAWASRNRYDPTLPFYAWYHRILKNLCLDLLRARKHVARDEAREDRVAGKESDQEAKLIAREEEEEVQAAIKALPEDLRELIELRHFQDASYEELAAILEIPIGTVMSRLYRARKLLATSLSNKEGSVR
jgi:RNA polymerase sigma-70 factor (ECF subfamily)